MQISSQIKKAYSQLLSQEEFLENIHIHTQAALRTIFNQPLEENSNCPSSYIFVLNTALQSEITLSSFYQTLPQQVRNQVQKVIKQYLQENGKEEIDNTLFKSLVDVKWQMTIENGREVYEVHLFTSSGGKPFTMRLNYEQLSILTFQVSQVVSTISQTLDCKQ